jgi:hypothetical protein
MKADQIKNEINRWGLSEKLIHTGWQCHDSL